MIARLAGSAFGRALAALGALLALLLAALKIGERKGIRHERKQSETRDRTRAEHIRRAVGRARTGGLRPDDIRYRD